MVRGCPKREENSTADSRVGGRGADMKPTIALYCRVSTDEQAQHGFSIENQKERLIAYCKSQGWDNYRLYVDDGYTGTQMDRPALQRLIQHVRDGQIHTVLVYKLDRLSRKQRDLLYLLEEEFEKNRVSFRSSTEPFDTASSLGKAMLGILAVFAQLERDTIVDRLATGLRQRVRAGKWSGGRVPFGYTYNQPTGKLDINPQQAALVRDLFHRYIRGAALNDLADWMASQTNERVFNHGVIRDMLQRRVYIGESVFGDTSSTDIADPIVELATFEQAQHEMQTRRHGKSPAGVYLLTGLLRCAQCDAPFIHVIRRNTRGNKPIYHLYACKNQHHRPSKSTAKPCAVGYRNQADLEQFVVRQFHRAALDPFEMNRHLERRNATLTVNRQTTQSLQANLKKVDAKLEKWYDAFEEGTVNPIQLQDHTTKLERQKRSLIDRLAALQEEPSTEHPDVSHNALNLIRQSWDYMTFSEQRDVLRAAIDTVIVPAKGQEPQIIWNH